MRLLKRRSVDRRRRGEDEPAAPDGELVPLDESAGTRLSTLLPPRRPALIERLQRLRRRG